MSATIPFYHTYRTSYPCVKCVCSYRKLHICNNAAHLCKMDTRMHARIHSLVSDPSHKQLFHSLTAAHLHVSSDSCSLRLNRPFLRHCCPPAKNTHLPHVRCGVSHDFPFLISPFRSVFPYSGG